MHAFDALVLVASLIAAAIGFFSSLEGPNGEIYLGNAFKNAILWFLAVWAIPVVVVAGLIVLGFIIITSL